ncbi:MULTISPECIES: hypothetical protein [unclassified Streptomyces]|uniref:hypothetical protein n=1 Tax=unclassified Streptomyces TaxID=2593676 RepID=UPI0008909D88|nr:MULTISPECIES: hypothetical protein [unclassified Streptomyces]PBC72341.1 hypothetical protein BX261_7425 [Streptomyces sp. 2321.6]SDR62114.1 hypothetical protein SAMN05216511_7278 [Streptomyces sp. KS_16]SEE50334.1 hypothetical protein SAMN05428940_7327 [Streptomyces sp. 2133.1]SNC77845.1 hypothetical protein SAMN06272741_7261 [Streptomyces sp. 2114.4]
MSARTWNIAVSCPRPKPRVSVQQQEWHLTPERIQRSVDTFFAPGSSLDLTSRTVRLRTEVSGTRLGDRPDQLEARLAVLLDCLYFDTRRTGAHELPSPVRFDIVEQRAQTPPTEGDQMT